jgi:hypothetical protein
VIKEDNRSRGSIDVNHPIHHQNHRVSSIQRSLGLGFARDRENEEGLKGLHDLIPLPCNLSRDNMSSIPFLLSQADPNPRSP